MFLFGDLRSFLPKINATCIDNHAFRMHYKVTMIVLIIFVILVTSREYMGDPISCSPKKDNIPEKVVDQFCWVQATFSMPHAFDRKIGEDIPYPGIGIRNAKNNHETIYRQYYQWVAFMLFLQAVMFYIPRHLWKIWEGGKIKMLLMELNSPVLEEKEKEGKLTNLRNYFNRNLHMHNGYLFRFVFCEILNVVNIIGQLYLTDRFLGWEFMTYGTRVLEFTKMDQDDRTDPMIKVFPRVTKCRFHQIGSTGEVEKFDYMCILPLNIVNEKIYIFLWFWFILLAVVTVINIIYRLVVLKFPSLQILLLRARTPLVPMEKISHVVHKCHVGDWFILYLLSKNMHHMNYADFVDELVENLGTEKRSPYMKEKEAIL